MREKVINAGRELGLELELRKLDSPTRTVAEAAEAVGSDEAQIAKSIVFVADGDPVIVVASGEHRIDTDELAVLLDVAEIRQAGPDEVRSVTGFPVGGVPPFAHGLPVVLDEALLRHRRVWAAAGDCNSLFAVDPRELVRATGARVASVGG